MTNDMLHKIYMHHYVQQYDSIFQLYVDTVYAEDYNYYNDIQCVFHNNIILFLNFLVFIYFQVL